MDPIYVINYDNLAKNKEIPAYMRELVATIQKKSGTTIGTWLKDVSTVDLLSISNASMVGSKWLYGSDDPDNVSKDSSAILGRSYLMLVNVLAHAEGLEVVMDVNVNIARTALLDKYIGFELLKRKGMDININYRNLSLNEDSNDPGAKLPIVKTGERFQEQVASFKKVFKEKIGVNPNDVGLNFGPNGSVEPSFTGIKATFIDTKGRTNADLRAELEERIGRKLDEKESEALFPDVTLWECISSFGYSLRDWWGARWANRPSWLKF